MSALTSSAPELARMLVLSTEHMRPETAAAWVPACPWACFTKSDYGWFMYVSDDPGITETSDVPLEIRSALHVARRHGCGWIMWDNAGPILDELPRYDW